MKKYARRYCIALISLTTTGCLSSSAPFLRPEPVFSEGSKEVQLDKYNRDGIFYKKSSSIILVNTNMRAVYLDKGDGNAQPKETSFEKVTRGIFSLPVGNFFIAMQRHTNKDGASIYFYGISFFDNDDIYIWSLDSTSFRDLSHHRNVDLAALCNNGDIPTASANDRDATGVWLEVKTRDSLLAYINRCIDVIRKNKIEPSYKLHVSNIKYN